MPPQPDADARQTGMLEGARALHHPRWYAPLLVGGCLIVAALSLWNLVLASWLQDVTDNWQYGQSRTFQLDAVVGHEDSLQNPTHFVAFDLHGRVVVMEMPGGEVRNTRIYVDESLIVIPNEDADTLKLYNSKVGCIYEQIIIEACA